MTRLTRLRTTAERADLREMTNPRRGKPRVLGRASTVKYGSPDLTGCAKTLRKSALLLSLARRAKRALFTLGGQTGAAFGTAGLQDSATGLGSHTGTKPMGALAMNNARLKSPLH
jgi:hypothetical protein